MIRANGLVVVASVVLLCSPAVAGAQRLETVDRVWSAHPVPFALTVSNERIYVGYYDANRQLSIASRARAGTGWTYQRLPVWTGWDSHNGIAMAVDGAGQLHVTANMHNDPLIYFRTSSAGDVRTVAKIAVMAEPSAERSMTYPAFLKDAAGRLIFKYRDGGSGRGRELYNRYDVEAKSWKALLTTALVDGEGKRSAYFVGPMLGPDGYFHLTWVWRDTPDAATNHDLSYAKSRDLVRWEKSDGTPLQLPIRLATAEIVDPVPIRAGMINNNTVLGFDGAGRPMITFHKFDSSGNTQIYVARRETAGWRIAQASDWKDFRWDFGGGGSLDSRLTVSGPVADYGLMRVSVTRDGAPIELLLDPITLKRRGERRGRTAWERIGVTGPLPDGMQWNVVEDASGFVLAWPTLPPNRDLPREQVPPPTTLQLFTPKH
jgi:hypothetical protein